MVDNTVALRRSELFGPGVMAAALAFGGLPLYIHAPRYYADDLALGLPIVGGILLAARAFDSIQDPIIGWAAMRLRHWRELWAIAATLLLAAGFAILFAPTGFGNPAWRLAIGLFVAFTGFSSLQIALLDHGLAQAQAAGGGYSEIALWREVGGLAGVCLAALSPVVIAAMIGADESYPGYAVAFAFVVGCASWRMAGRWRASNQRQAGAGFSHVIATPGVAPLLCVGFINALPTAVTSTLFLFFVGDVLSADAHAGLMLLTFFVCAALAAPLWTRLAGRIGRKNALAAGMAISVPAFIGAFTLGSGDAAAFYAVAAASGAALGADMVLAPAMLASRILGGGEQVFALWTFLQKGALAIAAGIMLPLLAWFGYDPGNASADQGQTALRTAYALVPCGLKILALAGLLILVRKDPAS